MLNFGRVSLRSAIAEIENLIKVSQDVEDDVSQTLAPLINRKLAKLSSEVLEFKELVMESDYDHPILLRMINEEVKRMNKEYNGADPAKLDGPTQGNSSTDFWSNEIPVNIHIVSISKGDKTLRTTEDLSLNLIFDKVDLEYCVVASQGSSHDDFNFLIYHYIQVVHADNKIAFVPVPNQDFKPVVMEMPKVEGVATLLKELNTFTTWHHE